MSSVIQFPDAETMITSLSNHPDLKTESFQKNGITKAISEHVADLFANNNIPVKSIKNKIMLVILNLKSGKDGFSGKSLPNLGLQDLDCETWMLISTVTEKAILDCAQTVRAYHK